ncbi:MAG TPA: hypothetical protein VGG35_04850 [Streptosporangiaceae bacterium]|jgi:hypothetical protein
MRAEGAAGGTVTLWSAAGQAELDAIAASGWRAWPQLPGQRAFRPVLDRDRAAAVTRAQNVPRDGVGYLTRLQVRSEFLGRYDPGARAADGGYEIPAGDLASLNASIDGAIREEARYLGPVSGDEVTRMARALDEQLPEAWRAYLTGPSWFARGWLPSGCYLWLYTPDQSVEVLDARNEAGAGLPGVLILGTDGSREILAADIRSTTAPVVLIDITGEGWDDALPQAPSLAEFIGRVEAGTFEFRW